MECLPNNKNEIVTFVKLYKTGNRETVHQVRTFVTISGDLVQGPSYNMVSIFDFDSNSRCSEALFRSTQTADMW